MSELTDASAVKEKPEAKSELKKTAQNKATPAVEDKVLSDNPQIEVSEDLTSATVKLFYHIGEQGEIDSLTMRRPVVRDTILAEKLAEGSRSDMFISRLANICEVTFSDFEFLDELEDLENLTEAYRLLKSSSHKTAEANPNITIADDRRSCEIKLQHPKTIGDTEYQALVLRRPTLKDSTDAEKQSEFQTEVLAHKYASLCDVPVELIFSLDDIDDFTSLDQAYGMFRRPKAHR